MARGSYRHRVTFQQPGAPTPDGAGGYTETWADLPPGAWFVSIAPASPQDLERLMAGTVITQVTHLVKGDFLAGVTSASRMLALDRVFAIVGPRNVDERSITMELLAVELAP